MALTLSDLNSMLDALKAGNANVLVNAIDALKTRIKQPAKTRTLYYKGEGYGQYLYRIDEKIEGETDGKTTLITEQGKETNYPTSQAPQLEAYTEYTIEITPASIHINDDATYKIDDALKNPDIQTKVFEALFSVPMEKHMQMVDAFCNKMNYGERQRKKFCTEAIVYLQTIKHNPRAAQNLYNNEKTVHTPLEKQWQSFNRMIDLIDWLKEKECLDIIDGKIQFRPNLSHHALRDLQPFLEGLNYNAILTAKDLMQSSGAAGFIGTNYSFKEGLFKTLETVSTIDESIRFQLDQKKRHSSIFTQAGRGIKEFAYSYVPKTKRVGASTTELMTQWEALQTKNYDPLRAEPNATGLRNRY